MLFEFCGGAVIKVKIKGFLRNKSEEKQEIIDTFGIQKSNIINYIIDNTKYKLVLDENKIILQRDNDEFSHEIIFEQNKTYKSEYFLKQLHHSLEFNIETINIELKDNKIDIEYKILETETIYNYVIEMSDKI